MQATKQQAWALLALLALSSVSTAAAARAQIQPPPHSLVTGAVKQVKQGDVTAGATKPVDVPGTAKPVDAVGAAKPIDAPAAAKPGAAPGTAKPVAAPGTAKPVAAPTGAAKPPVTIPAAGKPIDAIVGAAKPGAAPGKDGGEDDYGAVLNLAYLFYEGQMSGKLPEWNRLLVGKPGGYKASAHLNDGKEIGKDLSGGFYDAGDYLKCPHALAWTMANLALSMMEFRDAYIAAEQWDNSLALVKWGIDWLVKAHVSAGDNPADNAFVGQVSARPDHWYFGRPEHATNPRPIYLADSTKPGADLASEYAAAYAAGAVLFKGVGQTEYAEALYKHAKQAYAFAKAYPQNWKTPQGVFQAYTTYWPDGYTAQYAWAAAWMCKYDAAACPEAIATFNGAMRINNMKYGLGYDWDSVMPGVAAVLVPLKLEGVSEVAATYLEGYVLAKWEDTTSKCPKESYANVCYTPKGLAYYSDWGTLRNTGNMMFLATLMGKYGQQAEAHTCWARSQMRYILGTSTGKSYLIGYGPDQPQRPHHRQSACAATYKAPCVTKQNGTCCAGESGETCCNVDSFMSSKPAVTAVRGGLVGGPDQTDKFPDIRNDYQRSEVALDFNAGFTAAAAGLASLDKARKTRTCTNAGTGAPACKKINDYSQCGGEGNTCPAELAGKCIDGPWKGYCCPAGQTCQRNNQYFWICKAAVPQ